MVVSPHITSHQVRRILMAVLFLVAGTTLAACGSSSGSGGGYGSGGTKSKGTIKIGMKNFAENEIIAAMYSLLLQKNGFTTSLHQLNETPALQSAITRGDIDLYPEYTGTGLIVLGMNAIVANSATAYSIVSKDYPKRFKLTWLQQSPMNDTNGVAVTQATAAKYHLTTLSDLAKAAPQLSFGEDPACKTRPDCLQGMESKYGIHFKSVADVGSPALRYKGLLAGTYDVIEVFTTDPPIEADHLVVLSDNKTAVFPADHIAPVIRDSTLKKYPEIRGILNALAPDITTPVMIRLNGDVYLHGKPYMAVARSFLKSKGLL